MLLGIFFVQTIFYIYKNIMYYCGMKNQLYKGSLQTIILKMLAEQGKMYGYQLTQAVKELTNGELKITEGALYPTLHKMEEKGILTSETQEFNGRLRKYYLITEKGKQEKVNKLEELESFMEQMKSLLNLKPSGI